jgi:subtilisin
VAFAVAAGNSDADANNYSPAAFDNVLTVSALADFNGLPGGGQLQPAATDQDDTLADFSNWGSAVDIAAPGVCILSTYPIEQGSYGTISGTSMASPHAAGALALLASR